MALGLLLGFFVLSLTGIHSTALTTSSISCVTAEDAPSVTLSLLASGDVAVTPTSLVCNGESVSLTLTTMENGKGNVSVEVPPPTNVYIRDIFAGVLQTEQIATCISSGCTFSATRLSVFAQVEEFFSYKISGGGIGILATHSLVLLPGSTRLHLVLTQASGLIAAAPNGRSRVL